VTIRRLVTLIIVAKVFKKPVSINRPFYNHNIKGL